MTGDVKARFLKDFGYMIKSFTIAAPNRFVCRAVLHIPVSPVSPLSDPREWVETLHSCIAKSNVKTDPRDDSIPWELEHEQCS